MIGVWLLGAAVGSAVGAVATVRGGIGRLAVGVVVGAASVAMLLSSIVALAGALVDFVKLGGIWTGVLVGLPYGAAVGYLLGGLGVAFFGFLFRPEPGVLGVLGRSFGRGALIVALLGAFFGGLSGAVVGALRRTGLL